MASELYGMVVFVFHKNICEGPKIKVLKFWLQHIESVESKPKAFNTPLFFTYNSQIKLTPMKKIIFHSKMAKTLTPLKKIIFHSKVAKTLTLCFFNHHYGGKFGHCTKNQTPIIVIFL
jgi:hypothetical protein